MASPRLDPLGLLYVVPPEVLAEYHDERVWLELTAHTQYPDSVVALTRHMLWQENLAFREPEFSPDLVVTARPGWYFGTESTPGTTHGYPLFDAMRATLFVSGPNVRRGTRIDAPCRLVDLTPTMLEMVGVEVCPEDFDGTPLRLIYQCDGALPPIEPVFWDEVDLGAWHPLAYCPVKPYEHRPLSINRPNSRIDLNNLAYSVASIGEISVLRLFDDVLFPLSKPVHPLSDGIERHDLALRHGSPDMAAEAALALDVSNVTLGDYSQTSTGNLMRLSRTIDWLQHRSTAPADSPAAGGVNAAIDWLQDGFWEVYQFGQRIAVQLLDETLLNGIENGTDRTLNALGRLPAEVIIE